MTETTTVEIKYKPNNLYFITGIIWLFLGLSRFIFPILAYPTYIVGLSFLNAFLFLSTHYLRHNSPYLILDEESIKIKMNHLGWTSKICWADVLEVSEDGKRIYLKEKKNEKIQIRSIYLDSLSKEDAEQLLPLIQSFWKDRSV